MNRTWLVPPLAIAVSAPWQPRAAKGRTIEPLTLRQETDGYGPARSPSPPYPQQGRRPVRVIRAEAVAEGEGP